MKSLRKLISIVMILSVLISTIFVISERRVEAATNPYSGGYANCTWTAWQLCYESTGHALPAWGNAGTWLSSAVNAGYSTGTAPRENSVAVWQDSDAGHVCWITGVNGNNIYVKEGGYLGAFHEGWVSVDALRSEGTQSLAGFIYIGSLNQKPVGCIDFCENRDNKLYIQGWVYDPDEPSKSLAVHVYANDEFIYDFTASGESPDVNSAYSISGKHRFAEYIDLSNGNYKVNVYAIDSQGGANPCLGSGPNKQTTYSITINKPKYSITTAEVTNGKVQIGKTNAYEGEEIFVITSPSTGYQVDTIKVNGVLSGNSFMMPAKNTTVEVKFKKTTYKVTLGNVNNGKVDLSKSSANYGDEITVSTLPATGYDLDTIKVNGSAIDGNKFKMPAKNTTVEVTFKKTSYKVTLGGVSNGTVNLSKTSANYGDEITVSTTAATGYVLDTIKVNGSAISGNKFKMPAKNTSVEVTFKPITNTVVPQVTVEPSPVVTEAPITTPATAAVGTEFTFDGSKLKVTGDTTVEFVKASDDSIVKIPSTVELNGKTYIVNSVADKAFMNNKKLTQIIIGKNVTKIGDNAFYGCKKLKTVSGGEKVKTIGVGAFMECTKLKSITIGPKVTSIGASAFQGNKSLKTVIVKSKKLKAKKVGANAFKGIAKKAVFKIPKAKAKKYQPMFKKVSKGTKITFKKS